MKSFQQFKKHKPNYSLNIFRKSKKRQIGTLLILILFAGLLFSFHACKKKNSGGNNNNTTDQSLFEAFNSLNDTRAKFLDFADSTNGDPKQSIMLTKKWLDQQPGVTSTDVTDSVYLLVTMDNGIGFGFNFTEVDENDSSVYRGSDAKGEQLKHMVSSSGTCSQVINNLKILFYAARFYPTFDALDYLKNSDKNFDVTVLTLDKCKPELLETFNEYGLVILDTHGWYDAYVSGSSLTFTKDNLPKDYISFRDETIKQIGETNFNRLVAGELRLSASIKYNPSDINWWKIPSSQFYNFPYDILVTSKYIENSPQLNNTIVFGNMCYSGAQKIKGSETPIATAFLSRNPASYYGYAFNDETSSEVSNSFAKTMEDSLIRSLVIDHDSTGNAYLKYDNTEFEDPLYHLYGHNGHFYFKHFGSPSWCYGGCGEPFNDTRDGQQYQTVCIGSQTWMAQNLNWAGAGVCYDNNSSNCETYGRLYSIDEVTGRDTSSTNPSGIRGICPSGWHVPSKAEWEELFDYCGGIGEAANKLRATTGWPAPDSSSDEFNFNLLPAGEYTADANNSLFRSLGKATGLWTSSGDDSVFVAAVVQPQLVQFRDYSPPPTITWKFSLRCVKDK